MATESDNGQSSEEATVNAAAAAEQDQATGESKDVATTAQDAAVKSTDKAAVTEQPKFDAQKSYSDLERSYKELQKFSTQTSQERSELKKHLQELQDSQKQLQEMIAKATEAPFDLEKFNQEFQQKGPAALDEYFQKKLKAALDTEVGSIRQDLNQTKQENLTLRTRYEVTARMADQEHYPDFAALYPKMLALSKDEKCPVDFTKPVEDILDALYNLAKTQSSDEAVKLAAEQGRKQAQAEAAKESRTTVATSGKKGSVSSPNLETMPLGDLEKLVVQMHGIADRD